MKKLLTVMGLSFLLAGCFEQAKVEKSDKPAEKTETLVAEVKNTESQSDKISQVLTTEKSVNQEDTKLEKSTDSQNTQINTSEASSAVDENKKAESNTQDVVVAKETIDNALKTSIKDAEHTKLTEAKSADENQETISKVAEQKTIVTEVKVVDPHIVETKRVTKILKHNKSDRKIKPAQKTEEFDYNSEGLSPEEQRVGAQRVLTEAENIEMKWKCRHPFMSEQEVIDFKCEAKEAITH